MLFQKYNSAITKITINILAYSRSQQTFSLKNQIINILGFEDLCTHSLNSAIVAWKQPQRIHREPVWLCINYLQKEVAGQIWNRNHSWPTPGV